MANLDKLLFGIFQHSPENQLNPLATDVCPRSLFGVFLWLVLIIKFTSWIYK